MKKILISLSFLLVSTIAFGISGESDKVITFRFVPGDDMFYIPWEGNGEQLIALYALIDEYREEITSGGMPVYVDGYCSSMPTEKENRHMAFVRANRVKSELITQKGLSEEHFITKNYTTAYDGHKDMVVVTLHIPAKADEPVQIVEQSKREESEIVIVEQPQQIVVEKEKTEPEQQPVIISEPAVPSKPYCFAVRTNLLYDAFLTPTLGVEWRISPSAGIKLDGSLAWWGDQHGKVQKIWLLNPEVRWYMLDLKRFYVGASANFGEYNIYKGMIGGLFSDNTGYQGNLWGAGLTVGYQLHLSHGFSLDFNLGLGYTNFEYDSFTMVDKVRVYKDKNKSKDFWGPTQVGVSLVWTIGGNK